MGSDKAFLPYPTGSDKDVVESLWIHLVRIMLQVCPHGVLVSHNPTQAARMKSELGLLDEAHKVRLVQDAQGYEDIGPAAGLITAHDTQPTDTFLAVAVDFPFVNHDTLVHLRDAYESPVTTYFHPVDMHPEPLLSIWSPEALARLKRNAVDGVEGGRKRTGPCFTAKQLWKELGMSGDEVVGKCGVLPKVEAELRNTNTREEWDRAVDELRLAAVSK